MVSPQKSIEDHAMRNAFADEITALAEHDSKIVLLSGDIGNRLFDKLRAKFPERFLNCGVAEANMMGVAAGMAMSGLHPIIYTITPFTTTRCLEQIRVDVAYHNAPVVIVGTGAGLSYASLGPTHHSLEDFAIFRAIPNIQVVAPYDSPSLRAVLRDVIGSGKPTYIRIGKKGEKDIIGADRAVGIGKAVTAREGTDVCIIAVGTVASEAITAAESLKENGVSAQVVLVHTVKPFDTQLIDALAKRFKLVLTVEEHSKIGGYGEQVAVHFAEQRLDARIVCLGTPDEFMHTVGSQSYARTHFGIDAASIAKAVVGALSAHS
jgi:transketolase